MSVEYRDIPGFPGYRVGSDGSVWSIRRNKLHEWRLKSQRKDKKGRPRVMLMLDGKPFHKHVCRLVLLAFVGPCPAGMEACHFPDRDPANNSVENLRWDTRSGNRKDQRIHGTDNRGERHGRSKITEDDVRDIRRMLACGESLASIATAKRISKSSVADIKQKRHWSYVI